MARLANDPWPTSKFKPINPAAREAILLSTGAMNPIHRGHVAMLHAAVNSLRAEGYDAIRAYVSPSHDGYVQPKAQASGTVGLSAGFRLEVARRAVAEDPLVAVGSWESTQPGGWPDYPEVCASLRLHSEGVRVFYVCGTDHATKCGIFHTGMGEVGVVVVPRADDHPPPPGQPAKGVFVAAPAQGEAAAFSSTKVRKALADGDMDAASRYLSPAAARFMLRPTIEEHAAFEDDYLKIGIQFGVPPQPAHSAGTPAAQTDFHAVLAKRYGIAIDCGSGGSRAWQREPRNRLWSSTTLILARALERPEDAKAFAAQVAALGQPVFIGATAGLRYALEIGKISPVQIDSLRELLSAGSDEFRILSGDEEAACELAALRACAARHGSGADTNGAAFVSMGGRSMQCGREGALHSLPFASHLGIDRLERGGVVGDWHAAVSSLAAEYLQKSEAAKAAQGIAPISGLVVGIVDVAELILDLEFAGGPSLAGGPPLSTEGVIGHLEKERDRLAAKGPGDDECRASGVSLGEHLGRVCALEAVVRTLFDATTTRFVFPAWLRSEKINWTEGYFELSGRV